MFSSLQSALVCAVSCVLTPIGTDPPPRISQNNMCRHPAEGHWPQQVHIGNPVDFQTAVIFICLMSYMRFSAVESKMYSCVDADGTDRASNSHSDG